MTPEQVAKKIIDDNCDWVKMARGGIHNLYCDIRDAVRDARTEALEEAVRLVQAQADEHTGDDYGKRELELAIKGLKTIAAGEEWA